MTDVNPFDQPSSGGPGEAVTSSQSVVPLPPEGDHVGLHPAAPRRRWPIVVAVVGGVLLIGVLAAFMFVRQVLGSPLDAAQAIPADTQFVVTVDFLHFVRDDKLENTIEAFARPLRQAGLIDETDRDALTTIDAELEDEFGITASDDIAPWIGRSAALAIREIVGLAEAERPTGLLLALDVRDRGAAADFVDKLPAIFTRGGTGVASEIEVAGRAVGLYEPADEASADTLFVLEKDLLLLASDRATLRAAFDAIEGESLAEDETFRSAIDELEADRGVTMYVSSAIFDEIRDEMAEAGLDLDANTFGFDTLSRIQAIAGAAGLSDEGAWLDVVQIYDGPAATVTAASSPPLRDTLPASTFFYLGATYDPAVFDEIVNAIRDEDPEAFDEFVEEFEANVGIHPITDIVDHLAGGFGIAALPARAGILSTSFDVNVGFVGATAVDNPGALGDTIDEIAARFIGDGIELDEDGGVTRVFVDRQEAFSYALTDTDFVVGTSSSVVREAIGESANSLPSSQLYQDLDAALPGEGMIFYLDVQRMLNTVLDPELLDPETTAGFLPIRGFGAANRVEGNIAVSRVVMLIDFDANFTAGT